MTIFGKQYSGGRKSLIVVVALILILGTLKFSFRQNNILSYDYFGLYLYLPATFIYHDPGISNLTWLQEINTTYNNTPMLYQIQPEGSYNLIRFFVGMAILLSPFFFIGHAVAMLTAFPADGFSLPYQLAMMLAALFYVALGLVFLRKVLLRYFDDLTTSLTIIALFLGTNLFFWSTFDAGAPHTILLSLYAVLLWYTIRWHDKPNKFDAAAIGLLLGLIIVSRPSDIIAVFVPLLWNIYDKESLQKKLLFIRKHYLHVIILVFFTFLAGLPQLLYYYVYTGKFFLSTYNDPQSGFNFSNPRFAWVLFSFQKGWFIYAPLMIFSIVGLLPLWKKQKSVSLAITVHLLLNIFLLASFTSLISYGWRAFIQSYALLALPLAAFISFILLRRSIVVKIFAGLVLLFFIPWSVLQGYQIMTEIIDPSRMTREYFVRIIGKTEKIPADRELLRIDRYFDDNNGYRMPQNMEYWQYELQKFDFNEPIQYHERFMIADPADSTNGVYQLSVEMPFAPGVKVANKEISKAEYYWARMTFRVFSETPVLGEEFSLVATYSYKGNKEKFKDVLYKYRSIPVVISETGEWKTYAIDYLAPEAVTPDDWLETYLWYRGSNNVLVDDFAVTIYEPVSR